jgi:putative transposase
MAIKNEILDELLKDKDPKTIFSSEGLLGELKKALAERVLNAEMDHHLADSTQDEVSEGEKPGNRRNGYSKKTVLSENEAMELAIPRDRHGSFEPQLIAKYQRRFPGFDDKIISMYARGMSARGDPGPFARSVWHRGLPAADLHRDRCGARGSRTLAEPAAGSVVRVSVLRCVAGEDAR